MAVRSDVSARSSQPLFSLDQRTVIAWVLFFCVAFLVVAPLIFMVAASFRPSATFPLERGEWTLANYPAVFQTSNTWAVIRNTVVYSFGTLLLAVPMALGLAFLTERTDVPARSLLYSMMFVPMVTPVFATALGWVLLAGPRAGAINEYIRFLFGIESRNGPFNIYTMQGMIVVTALGIVPSMWLLLVSVLRNMDPSLEEAGATAGASRWRVLRKVTLPLMLPGILAVVIYFGIAVMESFEIPLALGVTAGVQVLSTKIYFIITATDSNAFNYGTAATFGIFAALLGIAGISVYLWLIRRANKYTVVTGKAYRPKLVKLGNWRYLALGLIMLYMFVKVIMPFSMILYASFLDYYVPPIPGRFGQIPWTLDNYRLLFDYRFFGRSLVNTAIVVLSAASITMLLVTAVSWASVRIKTPITHITNTLTFLPLAIPGVIVTLAFFLMFLPTPLYGSLILIVIAFLARFLAYATRLMYSAQVQIHKELEEASLVSGIGNVSTLVHVNLRLLLPAFLNGWLYIVTHAAKDFTTPLLIATSGSLLVANVIYGRFEGGRFPVASAAMVALVLILVTVVFIGRKSIARSMRA